MARQLYGAGTGDFTTDAAEDVDPHQPLLFWRSLIEGDPEPDVLVAVGTAGPEGLVYSDGEGRVGVYGPDGYQGDLWVSRAVLDDAAQVDLAASGTRPRYRLTAPSAEAALRAAIGNGVFAAGSPRVVNVLTEGAVGDWNDEAGLGTDSAAAFAAAIARVAPASLSEPAGVVYVPAGQYFVGPLVLPNRVSLVGDGPGASRLYRAGVAPLTGPFVSTATNARACTVRGLTLHGRGVGDASSHGLWLNNDAAAGSDASGGVAEYVDGRHYASDLLIQYTAGDGLRSTGRGVHMVSRVATYLCDGHGFVTGTDSFYTDCDAGVSGLDGFRVAGGNSRLTSCKAWYSGRVSTASDRGHGFSIDGNYSTVTLTGCEAQDNARAGFYLNDSGRHVISGCVADSNNTAGLGHAGFDFRDSYASAVTGCFSWERAENASRQLAAVKVVGGDSLSLDIGADSLGNMPQGYLATGSTIAAHRLTRWVNGAYATTSAAVAASGDGTSVVTVADLPTAGIVSAHRGGGNNPHVYPEGSLTAYRNAAALGAHILDVDVQRTSDGVLVVMHDTTVDRTTSGTGLVAGYPRHLLPPVDMRYTSGEGWAPEPVPTILDVLREFGGRTLLTLEAKSAADVPVLTSLIKSLGLERSVFINVNHSRGSDIQAIKAAGCLPHAWGLSTAAHVQAADANGAWLVELPFNAAASAVTAAQAAANIKRAISAPIFKRTQAAALAAGLQGYVSDALGHVGRSSGDAAPLRSIAAHIARQRIGAGWRTLYTSSGIRVTPLFTTAPAPGIVLIRAERRRRLLLGDLNGTRPAAGSITFRYVHAGTSTTHRSDFRVMVPAEEGEGEDTDSRGYVVGMRKSGELVMWTSPAAFGAGIPLGTAPSTAPSNTEVVTLRFSWDATSVTLARLDAAGAVIAAIGPVANTDWRGPDIMVGASSSSSSSTDLVLTGVDVA